MTDTNTAEQTPATPDGPELSGMLNGLFSALETARAEKDR